MEKTDIISFFEEQIQNHAKFIKKSVIPGHNGPYNDKETDVRNISHSILSICYYIRHTQIANYTSLLNERVNQLLYSQYKLENGLFKIRISEKKDSTNGVIGQAWVIESLVEGYKVTNNEKYLYEAINLSKNVGFNYIKKVWFIDDGNEKKIDRTLNHQLWFAMAVSLILEVHSDNDLKEKIELFLSNVMKKIKIHRNGLILHPLFLNDLKGYLMKLNYYIIFFKNLFQKSSKQRIKENGYHLFNVYAFAIINKNYKDWSFFKTNMFNKILNYSFSNTLINELSNNPPRKVNLYGYSYNAPAFELPIIYFIFKNKLSEDSTEILYKHLNNQIATTYSNETGLFDRNTNDISTLNYRFYELLRFL